MFSKSTRLVSTVVVVCAISALWGCGKSDSSSGTSAGGAQSGTSAIEQAAQDAAMAEVVKHCTKGPDGWTTAVISGSAYSPEHFLRQFHDVKVYAVQSSDLGDTDKLNGFEWAGKVVFTQTGVREAGESGIVMDGVPNASLSRQKGQWTQWVDYTPMPIQLQKVKGAWQVSQDATLLRGRNPTDADYAAAGVR